MTPAINGALITIFWVNFITTLATSERISHYLIKAFNFKFFFFAHILSLFNSIECGLNIDDYLIEIIVQGFISTHRETILISRGFRINYDRYTILE